jgi:amino acid permease
MQRTYITVLNFAFIIIGFFIIYSNPLSSLAITTGMFLISASIISFTILIYFPPANQEYVKLKIVESPRASNLIVARKTKKSKRKRK